MHAVLGILITGIYNSIRSQLTIACASISIQQIATLAAAREAPHVVEADLLTVVGV